ncbi:hypothetical protein [Candidatus Lokiarchaeum ossiferum]|uniref:hypothetical protein n=1 Tax=Candidatus Lokiarchaeum ossiferum TaxID=2951803 RepID=UPI00352E3D95
MVLQNIDANITMVKQKQKNFFFTDLIKDSSLGLDNKGLIDLKEFGIKIHYHPSLFQTSISLMNLQKIRDKKTFEVILTKICEYFFFTHEFDQFAIINTKFPEQFQYLLEEFCDIQENLTIINKLSWLDYQGCFFSKRSLMVCHLF